ncbi:mitochondrial sodium/calcium exchanger protein-like [Leptopilina boulardi]|uniref:mitochondrial sodium/calcium exchanger protein-like n=1 Tax=Leptopilina boulardi TaxID=63433 RepID=UPI0021F5D48E|nr:mitochondrial sodium/calcium exchanger protein-like [Leptopilina boulardi]XP_051156266.1 mitochondrial sodium/calcium exchanger protein-like [Leptopilina boulardi]XP_051156267.1 mitochondrial sodium/calcium exchanger protein-like [Leptopilina boulardi]XP_051156268.1 mitochondrial sodium/calcium exchanger protein-like [Leptopilina boulardi]
MMKIYSLDDFIYGCILLILWLLYLFLILATTSDNFFCPSLGVISTVFRLSDSIAGVTILAFGNGAPDIFTSLASSPDDSMIMFTELIGAGVFVTALIAGSVAVFAPFQVHWKSFLRDCSFYILATGWICYLVNDQIIHLWEALSCIVLYALFIITVVLMQVYDSREENIKNRFPKMVDVEILRMFLTNRDITYHPQLRSRAVNLQTKLDVAIAKEMERNKLDQEPLEQQVLQEKEKSSRPKGLFREFLFDVSPINIDDWRSGNVFLKTVLVIRTPFMFFLQLCVPVVNEIAEKRGWSKLLNCLQLFLTPIIVLFFFKAWNSKIYMVPSIALGVPIFAGIAIIVFLLTSADRIPYFHNGFAFLGFGAAMFVVYFVAGEVMLVLQCIGYISGISDAMLGITFLAWGNSIGDLISNVTIAKKGFPRMGYAACFGGPMFNTLLGLGLTYGIAAARAEGNLIQIRISDMAPGCLAFLFCSLLASMIYLTATGFLARRSYGFLLYTIYFSFILICFLSEFHIIHPLGTDHRPE